MKNLKIRMKIALGFGLVIIMMLIMATVVFLSNTSTLGDVNVISIGDELQTMSAELQSSFLNARVPANLLSNTMDPKTYADFTQLADVTAKNFEKIYALINVNPVLEKYRASYQNAEEAFTAWRANADSIGKLNEEKTFYDAQLAANGAALLDSTSYILDEQLVTAVTEINTDVGHAGLLRRIERLTSATAITRDVASARVLARQITGTYDPNPLPDALAYLDRARDAVVAYRDASLREVQKESAQAAVDAITVYRDALENFGQACILSAAAKAKMLALNLTTQEALAEAFVNIDVALAGRIESTISTANSSLVTVSIVTAIALIFAIAMAIVIMRGITVPVGKMHNVINIVGNTGRLNLSEAERADIESGISKDEIGQSIASFVKMLDRLGTVASALEKVADGDLTVALEPMTTEDTMGVGVATMIDSLNHMFAEINASTAQVSTASQQIADGAQELAQGSTEQAAAIQQLSGSIQEITAKTDENADMAARAASLAAIIKGNAEKGSQQMSQMMEAVKEINEAGQSISKVIKVIDDIAFQTNILALNAAVEAARAGQHGKGFAVVAEEVRSLAAKSAEAAKDSGALIENSIEKAGLGLDIATGTAASLKEIVEGINHSAEIVTQIAASSEEQSAAIGQINTGIDQVAQVVHQNSATAEQSAAASQEMSGQSDLLEQLIARFKLHDTKASNSHKKALALPQKTASAATDKRGGEYGKYLLS